MDKVRIVCSECGSEDVLRDAYASWDTETQQWELSSTYDNFTCCSPECDGNETDVEEVPVEDEKDEA